MRRVMAFLVLLMFMVTPLVRACMSPADAYAVEVVLNKPGINYNLWRFDAAHNVLSTNGTFIFRSHYDKRLYVLVWNASDGLHVRVGIPIERKSQTVSVASLNVSLLITEGALGKLRAEGWNITGNKTFERNGVRISLSPDRGGECTSDADCATGGCSGEVCAPNEVASKIVTPCVYRAWYDCLGMTTCGCLNGVCTWKPNPQFEACLRERGVDPADVVRAGQFELKVEAMNKSDGEVSAAVKDFLNAFGVFCDVSLTLVKTSVVRPSPAVDPSEVNASAALLAELGWLADNGVINVSESDINAIVKVAKWGFAGYNLKIGWYETGNGSYAWMPYGESKNPELVRCSSGTAPVYALPNGTAYFGPTVTAPPTDSQTSPEGAQGICGPASVVILPLLLLLFRRR